MGYHLIKRNSVTLAEKLFMYMDTRGVKSQFELATLAHVGQNEISKLISGGFKNTPLDMLVNICIALRLTPDQADELLLLGGLALSPAWVETDVYRNIFSMCCDSENNKFSSEELFAKADDMFFAAVNHNLRGAK